MFKILRSCTTKLLFELGGMIFFGKSLNYNDVFQLANNEFGSLINASTRIIIGASSEEIIIIFLIKLIPRFLEKFLQTN